MGSCFLISEIKTFAEIGRIDSQTRIDSIAFSPDSSRVFISRERESLAKRVPADSIRLFDPFYMNVAMVIREGASSDFFVENKGEIFKIAKKIADRRFDVEVWQVRDQTEPEAMKTWEAVSSFFADESRKAQTN